MFVRYYSFFVAYTKLPTMKIIKRMLYNNIHAPSFILYGTTTSQQDPSTMIAINATAAITSPVSIH